MFSQFRIDDYTCVEMLLDNQYAGRTTYLAQDTGGQNVILKKFEFATPRSSWSVIKAIEKEMAVLQKLNHPQIPKYLDYLEIECGFVLVIEYINASHLGCFKKRFTVEEVKAIAYDILQILVYLQKQTPPVVHRDIKPENILWDGEKAYLIDFGIATAATQTMTLTSTVGGTIGFTPPEILRGRKATLNSDLYSLGATIFCLLKNISSSEISNYISFDGTFDWSKVAEIISDRSSRWLQKLSHPNLAVRFQTPSAALEQINVLRPRFEEKAANDTKELLTQVIEKPKINKQISYLKTYTKARIECKQSQRQLNIYQKILGISLNILGMGNLGITLIMTVLSIIFVSPPVFLALNILQERNSQNFLIVFLITGLYLMLITFNFFVYQDCQTSTTIKTSRVLLLCANLLMRTMELVCFQLIQNNPNYYY